MADYDADLLSDEERAALEGDEDQGALDDADPNENEAETSAQTDGAFASKQKRGGEWGTEAADEDDDDDEGDDDQVPAVEVDDDTGSTPEAEPEPEPQQPVKTTAPQRPNIDIDQVNDVLANRDTKIKELTAQLEDLEITSDEFLTKLAEVNSEAEGAAFAKRQFEEYERVDNENWNSAVQGYLTEYSGLRASKEIMEAFDREVRSVTSDPAYASLSHREHLEQAHAIFELKARRIGLEGVPPLRAPAKPQKVTGQQRQRSAPPGDDLSTPPRTLARAPATEISGGSDDQFAQLDMLVENGTPDEIEAAFAKLPQDVRDAYSSRG